VNGAWRSLAVQVLLPLRREWLGCTLLVAITQAAKFHVRGDVLRARRRPAPRAPDGQLSRAPAPLPPARPTGGSRDRGVGADRGVRRGRAGAAKRHGVR
jgi:hypothetical protein